MSTSAKVTLPPTQREGSAMTIGAKKPPLQNQMEDSATSTSAKERKLRNLIKIQLRVQELIRAW
jgi:hypothetical protein